MNRWKADVGDVEGLCVEGRSCAGGGMGECMGKAMGKATVVRGKAKASGVRKVAAGP